jgi:hypothetical protein
MRPNSETNTVPTGHWLALVCIAGFGLSCASLTYPLPAGIPQVHHFGQEGLHNVLVIDLFGPNLEDLFDMCGRKFSIKCVCMLARQMVRLLGGSVVEAHTLRVRWPPICH